MEKYSGQTFPTHCHVWPLRTWFNLQSVTVQTGPKNVLMVSTSNGKIHRQSQICLLQVNLALDNLCKLLGTRSQIIWPFCLALELAFSIWLEFWKQVFAWPSQGWHSLAERVPEDNDQILRGIEAYAWLIPGHIQTRKRGSHIFMYLFF